MVNNWILWHSVAGVAFVTVQIRTLRIDLSPREQLPLLCYVANPTKYELLFQLCFIALYIYIYEFVFFGKYTDIKYSGLSIIICCNTMQVHVQHRLNKHHLREQTCDMSTLCTCTSIFYCRYGHSRTLSSFVWAYYYIQIS